MVPTRPCLRNITSTLTLSSACLALVACAARAPAPEAQASAPSSASDGAAEEKAGAPNAARARLQRLLAELEERRASDPSAGEARYALARFYANSGDHERALTLLRELAAIERWDLRPESGDFGPLAENEEFKRLSRTIAARAVAVPPSPVAFELDALDLLPEGIAWDPKRGRLLVGSMHQRAVRWADEKGVTRELVAPAQDGLLGVLGIEVDAVRDQLWVANSVAPFMRGYQNDMAGKSAVFAFSLEGGATVGRWDPPADGAMLNDLTVTGDGAVFVTDSAGGGVLMREADAPPGALKPFVPAETFLGPNGIVGAPGDDAIFVCDAYGLHRVERATGEVRELKPPPGVSTLGGIDGLDRRGRTLVAVQNLFSPGRVWALELDASGRELVGATLLDDNHPELGGPTTGAIAGERFLYLANASLQLTNNKMHPAPEGKRHVILGPAMPASR